MKTKTGKLLTMVLTLVLIFSMFSTSVFAATTVVTDEDSSVLTLASAGNTVTYQAVTVDGGIKDGVTYPTTTTYTYCIKTASTSSVSVSVTNPQSYTLELNGSTLGSTSFSLNKNTQNILNLIDSNEDVFRSFNIAVVDSNSVNVSIEINCYNTARWLNSNTSPTVSAAYNTLSGHVGGFNSIGKMTSVVNLNLPGGSTAMDALYAMKNLKGFSLSGTGSASGTGGSVYTYISAIDGLGEFMCGSWSGWCYVVDDGGGYTLPGVGASSYYLSDGEHVTWVYTCTYADINDAIVNTSF